jgi:hypothetical protein
MQIDDSIQHETQRKELGKMSEAVTIERLERGLALSAYLVVRHGPVAVPIFEGLERELATMRQTQDTVERAKRLQESYSGLTTRRAIEPPVTSGVRSHSNPTPDRKRSMGGARPAREQAL